MTPTERATRSIARITALTAILSALALAAGIWTRGCQDDDGHPISVHAQTAPTIAQYRHDGQAVLNDLTVTPGAVDPDLTAVKLCDPTFHTGTVRNVTQSMKRAACAAYGQTVGCPGKGFEIDHLVSIEVGGSNDPANLWPQPVDAPSVIGYHTKDVVENRAHAAVCAGKITLAQAQQGLATDWFSFGKVQGFLTPEGKTK
jgi:hypothetical protein